MFSLFLKEAILHKENFEHSNKKGCILKRNFLKQNKILKEQQIGRNKRTNQQNNI